MSQRRKLRAHPRGPWAVHHFPDGLLSIVGETKPKRRVSVSILSQGNPSGALTVSASPSEMLTWAAKVVRVCQRVLIA